MSISIPKRISFLAGLLFLLTLMLSDGSALAVNGDGNLDAVFGQGGGTNRVCTGDGLGGFSCSDVSAVTTRTSRGVALGDVDGDGNLDAVFANFNQTNQVCTGDGLGGFSCSNVSVTRFSTKRIGVRPEDGLIICF